MPRSAARTEEVGPFTLFVGTGRGRTTRGPGSALAHEFTVDDVEAARARKRELGQPEAFEWVHETTPSLLAAAREAGLEVLEAPLMVLERSALARAGAAVRAELRHARAPTTRRSPTARAVQTSASARPAPRRARRGAPSATRRVDDGGLDFLRERLRTRAHRDGRGRGRGSARSPPGCTSPSAPSPRSSASPRCPPCAGRASAPR